MKKNLFSIMCIFLITGIANADVSDNNAQLIQAAKDGNLKALKAAIANGAEVNGKGNDSVSALMWASQNGHTEAVKLLLGNGAIDDGMKALDMADKAGHKDIKELLLKDALTKAAKDQRLIDAALDGDLSSVQKALSNGANINVQTTKGATALWISSQKGYTDIVQLLLAK